MRVQTNKSALAIATVLLLTSGSAIAGKGYYHYGGSSYGYSSGTQNNGDCDTSCDSALGESVYNLVNSGIATTTTPSENTGINIDGVNIGVSAWADTYGNNDDIVVDANLYKISNYYGYGVTNDDWESAHNSPDHAIDNVNQVRGNWSDFDFVLFSFDQDVNLSGADFTWRYSSTDSQVSVAALDDITSLTSGTNTWSQIVSNALSAGSYDINKATIGYRANFDLTSTAKYWLVGAYNTVFGDNGGDMYNDAFKLSAIGFSQPGSSPSPKPPAEVGEPATWALLSGGLAFLAWRRKKIKS